MKPYFVFEYDKNKEKIFYITSKEEIKQIQIKVWEDKIEDDLGSCFCTILNSKDRVIDAKQTFNKNYSNIKIDIKTLNSDVASIVDMVLKSLLDINPYFIIIHDSLFKSTVGNIDETQDINQLSDIIKANINKLFDGIIETIQVFDVFYAGKSIIEEIYLPPSTISANNGKVTNKIGKYVYEIHTMDELLGVSFYLININNYHIKRCKFPKCNKYFATRMGQTRFCNNPSPFNDSVSCKNAKKTDNIEADEEPWQKELNNMKPDINRSIKLLYDHRKKTKNKREKEMLERNYELLKKNAKDFRTIMEDLSDKDRAKYLKYYKEYIKEIRINQLSHTSYKVKVLKLPKK